MLSNSKTTPIPELCHVKDVVGEFRCRSGVGVPIFITKPRILISKTIHQSPTPIQHSDMKILWLRATTGENISVGRERIAEHLRERSVSVDVVNTSGRNAFSAVLSAFSGNYDVIVGTTRAGLYVGYPLSRVLRTGFVADIADPIVQIKYLSEPFYDFFEWYERTILKWCKEVAVVYDETADRLDAHDIDYTRVENGVDYDRFANPDPDVVIEARDIVKNAGVDINKPIAIYLGGISTVYYIHDVLLASERCPDWQFVFIGEGPLECTINNVASDSDNVFFPGSFDYRLMPGFLSHASVGLGIVPIEQPLKILEYGAASLPTIAMRSGAKKRFSKEELFMIDPSPDAIVKALRTLRTNKDLSKRLGEALRKRAEETLWSDIADTYYQLIERSYR